MKNVDGVTVIVNGNLPDQEIKKYVERAKEDVRATKRAKNLTKLLITIKDNDTVELDYEYSVKKFERIRRITGYLVGTTDRWNDSKRAEEKDRVKHG